MNDHKGLMDRVYRDQRHIYDLTRKYYLLGRDGLIADLDVPAGGAVLEIGCGTGRNLIAVGKAWPLDLAAELTRERGRLVIAGYHQDGPRQINMWLWNWRGIDVVNAHERDPAIYAQGVRDAIAAVTAGRIDPAPLCSHRYPLEQLNAALDATRDKPDGFVKAVITL